MLQSLFSLQLPLTRKTYNKVRGTYFSKEIFARLYYYCVHMCIYVYVLCVCIGNHGHGYTTIVPSAGHSLVGARSYLSSEMPILNIQPTGHISSGQD